MAHDPFAVIADYFDLDLNGFQDDLALYEGFARRCGGPILELGAGTGRLAVPLAEAGFAVTGIDASEAMLAAARRKLGGKAEKNLRLVTAPMEDFRLPERFELVFCALGSFQHLETQDLQRRALENVRDHLAPGGLFVLDLPAGEAADWEAGVRPVVLEWTRERGDGTMVSKLASVEVDAARQLQRVTHIYEEWGEAGSRRRRAAAFTLRVVHRYEMELLLERTGLRVEALYGSYDLDPYLAESERMIFVAGRAIET